MSIYGDIDMIIVNNIIKMKITKYNSCGKILLILGFFFPTILCFDLKTQSYMLASNFEGTWRMSKEIGK